MRPDRWLQLPKFDRRGTPASRDPWADMKDELKKFWRNFGGHKCHGRGYPRGMKLRLLVKASKVIIGFQRRQSIDTRRENFNETKQRVHSMRSHGICFGCGAPATCRHHIIQVQNGGHNHRKNLVSLCDDCHAVIHPWLKDQARSA